MKVCLLQNSTYFLLLLLTGRKQGKQYCKGAPYPVSSSAPVFLVYTCLMRSSKQGLGSAMIDRKIKHKHTQKSLFHAIKGWTNFSTKWACLYPRYLFYSETLLRLNNSSEAGHGTFFFPLWSAVTKITSWSVHHMLEVLRYSLIKLTCCCLIHGFTETENIAWKPSLFIFSLFFKELWIAQIQAVGCL